MRPIVCHKVGTTCSIAHNRVRILIPVVWDNSGADLVNMYIGVMPRYTMNVAGSRREQYDVNLAFSTVVCFERFRHSNEYVGYRGIGARRVLFLSPTMADARYHLPKLILGLPAKRSKWEQ